jgi:hypothetical protein
MTIVKQSFHGFIVLLNQQRILNQQNTLHHYINYQLIFQICEIT